MELVLLRRLVAELAAQLQHRRIEQVYALPPDHLVVVVAMEEAGRLWFSAAGDEPHLYLREGGHPTPQRPPGFAMAARKSLRGRRIDHLLLLGDDRVVELRCGTSALIYELLPRRGSALLTEQGQVVAVWSPRRAQARPGDPYAPPPHPPRPPYAALDAQARAGLSAAVAGGSLGALARGIDGMTPLLAREVAARLRTGASLDEAVAATLAHDADTPADARIYAPLALSQLRVQTPPERLELAPYALASRADEPCEAFPSLLAAAAAYYPQRARLRLLAQTRTAVLGAMARRMRRLERARQHADADGDRSVDPGRLRQHADLLLANPLARTESGRVRLADLYHGNEIIEIEVKPEEGVAANAERLYRRAQRLERGRALGAARQQAADAEMQRLEQLRDHLAGLADATAAAAVVREAAALGLEVSWPRLADPEVPDLPAEAAAPPAPGPRPPGILSLTAPDGNEILVGRSARANELLTHQMAQRHDWWLHAGGPGAHVLLRNPERLQQPRPEALLAAARLAAWFSRERHAGKVEVHWTQARHVQRVRGAAAGTASMRQHHTLLVAPAPPAEATREP